MTNRRNPKDRPQCDARRLDGFSPCLRRATYQIVHHMGTTWYLCTAHEKKARREKVVRQTNAI